MSVIENQQRHSRAPQHFNAEAKIKCLTATLDHEWADILANSKLIETITKKRFDSRLYALYLIETYHYTLHNARNQALVGVRALAAPPSYVKFCFEHAAEETGHELMALHDLKQLGLGQIPLKSLRPLPGTEVLIAYLYWISTQGNALQRLGYSFWAESVYSYIAPALASLQSHLNLPNSSMTFFVAHSAIDAAHSAEVRDMITRFAECDTDFEDIESVMKTSLRLTGRMLDDVLDTYLRVKDGGNTNYHFLNPLVS